LHWSLMSLLGGRNRPSDEEVRGLAERLKGHVEVLAGLIGPRHLGKPSSMEAAAAYIQRQLGASGDAVGRQTYVADGAETCNLIVERRGVERLGEILVVGAHYDTVPETPGADDNASAVAMLLEVARLTAGGATRRTVRFVAFSCEEPPHFYTDTMGSDQYARACWKAGENVVGMLCLEMVGYYRDEPGSQQIPPGIPRVLRRVFPARGNFLTAVGNLKSVRLLLAFRRGFKKNSALPLYTVALPERIHEIRLSDNGSFWDFGYPALMITDTSFLRNPHYHQPSDTPDTLDYGRLAQATFGVAGAVAQIGRAIRR
jgi:Zn-dependent M28 family amino/carboxypeptidase